MAVEEVKLTSSGASGSADGRNSGDVSVSYSSTYLVKCDSPADDPRTVLNYFRQHSQYPWIGRTYKFGNGFDTTATCRKVSPSYIESSGGIYQVKCDFSDSDDEQGGSGRQDQKDPFSWTPEIEITSATYSAPVAFAKFLGTNFGKSPFMKEGSFLPVTNSALQPLDPTFEEEFSYKVIRFTTNLPEYDDAFYNTYQDTINSSDVTIAIPQMRFRSGVAKHYGRLSITGGSNTTTYGGRTILFYRRTIELAIRGWDRAILDQGTVALLRDGDRRADGTVVSANDLPRGRLSIEEPFKDADDMPTEKLVPLDGSGKRLSEGRAPTLLFWQSLQESDFSQIQWV